MPKGKMANAGPMYVETEAGKTYHWCSCGLSQKQPLCDGSHKGSEFHPVNFQAEKTGSTPFCGCKQTGHPPLCDGTHSKL